jgi:hypothetical protein
MKAIDMIGQSAKELAIFWLNRKFGFGFYNYKGSGWGLQRWSRWKEMRLEIAYARTSPWWPGESLAQTISVPLKQLIEDKALAEATPE